jgi:3-methyladenine DNA glycosylase/8-oxoguanine DNA glycosylase
VPPPDTSVACSMDYSRILRAQQHGRYDPTTQTEPGGWWRSTLTPDGPATVHIWWSAHGLDAAAWGPGGNHLLATVPALTGQLDEPPAITAAHPAVATAIRRQPMPRIGHSGGLYHTILPLIVEQRVTSREAMRSYASVVNAFGEVAPGPRPMRLPPSPAVLANLPYWSFHRFGIERKRADAIKAFAAHPRLLAEVEADPSPRQAIQRLHLLPGIGPWTTGSAGGPAFGDPDAIAVGDFWLCHLVTQALTGRPRGTDADMLELLQPYAGQRNRVIKLLAADGHRVQRFGPGIRLLPIARL